MVLLTILTTSGLQAGDKMERDLSPTDTLRCCIRGIIASKRYASYDADGVHHPAGLSVLISPELGVVNILLYRIRNASIRSGS